VFFFFHNSHYDSLNLKNIIFISFEKKKKVLLLPLVVFVIKVKAAPFYPQTPANTYLMDYSYPVPVDYYRNAAHEYRSASLLSAMSSTLTNQFQAIAGWQLSKMRKKWIKVICFFTPKPPKTSGNPQQKKCKKTINLPFPALRENPQQFDLLKDWEDWEEEEDDPEMFIPVVAYRNDAPSDPAEAIPSYKSPAVIPDDETNPTSVGNTDDDVVEEKSAAILTSLANSQMAVSLLHFASGRSLHFLLCAFPILFR
jgi:hypothetical protein